MSIKLILICCSFLLFIVYNSVALGIFGPNEIWSMSRTYYLYEGKKKHLGWIFTAFMFSMCALLMPAWLEVSDNLGSWMSNFTFLAFLAAAMILFVGAAPAYYEKLEGDVHMAAAKTCAATALAWCFIACWQIWYVPLIAMIVPVIIGMCLKTFPIFKWLSKIPKCKEWKWVQDECKWEDNKAYWLEMMAFDATFATIITAELVL